jgi:hypothetical protein
VEGAPGQSLACGRCGAAARLRESGGSLGGCLACGGDELYRHRDFNQKLGLLLLGLGVAAWAILGSFWPMVAAALLDLLLYFTLPDVAICYRCKAHHRDFEGIAALPAFDLERHEHWRFQRAREAAAAGASRPAGSGAPSTTRAEEPPGRRET